MRKFIIPLLLSSVVVPSMASARDGSFIDAVRSKAERSERDSSSESRPQRAERNSSESRSERPVRVERAERSERQQPVERQSQVEQKLERRAAAQQVNQAESQPQAEQQVERRNRAQRSERVRQVERVRQIEQAAPTQPVQRTERTGNAVIDGLREEARRGDRNNDNDGHDWPHNDRDNDGIEWTHNDHDRDHHRWSGNWRNDRRYDWSHYRSRYGSLYRLGRYYDPYGWGYHRFSVGYNLWPSYYGSSQWLDDPWMYRLPPAYGPYRWIRYYDDALLVNIYTGTVIDVVHNFFW